MWIADAIYKWAPNGNSTRQNFKLQGEYLRRTESGTLAAGDAVGAFDSTQSGWYLQGVYQFMLGLAPGLAPGPPAIGHPGDRPERARVPDPGRLQRQAEQPHARLQSFGIFPAAAATGAR
ncbi:hypothetical protein LP419_00285 [Massilia sp. H-1]|nr:hypothetical protein LP419_00285 [Massilia sp. H-1]